MSFQHLIIYHQAAAKLIFFKVKQAAVVFSVGFFKIVVQRLL